MDKCGICSIEINQDNYTTCISKYTFGSLDTTYIKNLPEDEYGGYLCVVCEEELFNQSIKVEKEAEKKMIKFTKKIKGRKQLPLKYYEIRKVSFDLNVTGSMRNKVVEIDGNYCLAVNKQTAKETLHDEKICVGDIRRMSSSNQFRKFYYNLLVVK